MNIHFLQHEAFETPAAIESWVHSNGHYASFTRFFNFEKLPEDVAGIDMLIVLGGPQSPQTTKEECAHFDAEAEISFIRNAIQSNVKVLGICLGAQLIGEALGAKVEHSPEREIGLFKVCLTENGKYDKLTSKLESSFDTGHWHGDMPGLSPGAEVLAYSVGCPRQIVRFAPYVYGFQCHFEFTLEAIQGMINNCESELSQYALRNYVQQAEQLLMNNYDASNQMLFKMLDEFAAC